MTAGLATNFMVRDVAITGMQPLQMLQGQAAQGVGLDAMQPQLDVCSKMGCGATVTVIKDGQRTAVSIPLDRFVDAKELKPNLFPDNFQARFVDGPVLEHAGRVLAANPALLSGAQFVEDVPASFFEGLPFAANPSHAMFFGVAPNDAYHPQQQIDWQEFSQRPLVPYGDVPSHILETSRHYGIQLFEGMKVYRLADGNLALFRPEMNARRMLASAHRLVMPEMPEDIFLSIVRRVVAANAHLIPPFGKGAAYLRPVMYASGAGLGVKPADTVAFGLTLNPVGPYFAGGATCIGLAVQPEFYRSGPKLGGSSKLGGNYATSLLPAQQYAKKSSFQVPGEEGTRNLSEVLYTDIDGNFQEAGAANVFFILNDGTILTPPLNGEILPGITRDSVITRLRDLGYTVKEKPVHQNVIKQGNVQGMFVTGTAAVVSPVGMVRFYEEDGSTSEHFFNNFEPHSIANQAYEDLVAIQEGRKEDLYGWVVPI